MVQAGAQSDRAAVLACFLCRVLTELVSKMRDMQMDKTELGCLRAIVLFNPGTASLARGLLSGLGPRALAGAVLWGQSPVSSRGWAGRATLSWLL